MRQGDLPVVVLEHEAVRALQNAGRAAAIPRGMLAELVAAAPRLDADQLDAGVWNERVEQSDSVAATADAGERGVGQTAVGLENLAARLIADDAMEVADHHRIRVSAQHRPEQVMCVADIGHPI